MRAKIIDDFEIVSKDIWIRLEVVNIAEEETIGLVQFQ